MYLNCFPGVWPGTYLIAFLNSKWIIYDISMDISLTVNVHIDIVNDLLGLLKEHNIKIATLLQSHSKKTLWIHSEALDNTISFFMTLRRGRSIGSSHFTKNFFTTNFLQFTNCERYPELILILQSASIGSPHNQIQR